MRLSIVDRARLNGDATLREEIARRVVRVLSALLEKRRISSFPFSLIGVADKVREIPAGNRCGIRILMEQPRIERPMLAAG